MKEIGVAIVGTGFMGWVHAEALRRVGVTITGATDIARLYSAMPF